MRETVDSNVRYYPQGPSLKEQVLEGRTEAEVIARLNVALAFKVPRSTKRKILRAADARVIALHKAEADAKREAAVR